MVKPALALTPLSRTSAVSHGSVALDGATNGAFAVGLAIALDDSPQRANCIQLTLRIWPTYTWAAVDTIEILTAR